MNVTSFGEITPDSLMKKGGSNLGTLLKQDIFEAPNLAHAMKLYDKVYQKVDQAHYAANNSLSTDEAGYENVQKLRTSCHDFYDVMSRNDVFNAVWNLDQSRGNTALFRDVGADKAQEMFPVFMRFFDLFHGKDFTDARQRVNEAANTNLEKFIVNSIPDMQVTEDKMGYAKKRFHFIAKYRGVRRTITKKDKKIQNDSTSTHKSRH